MALDYIPLTAAAGKKRTTAELRALAFERMRALGYPYVAGEFSPAGSGCRFDVIGLGRYTRQVRIYEVKSSRTDYLTDKKWERYLPYCTHFAFVAPAGAIARWELDRDIGLIEYGHPALERMLANRRFGFTIGREDALRSARPSRPGSRCWNRLPSRASNGPHSRTLSTTELVFERPSSFRTRWRAAALWAR